METKGLRAKRFPYPAPWGGTFLIYFPISSKPYTIPFFAFNQTTPVPIVAMPKDLFYGTGIGSYVWILNNNKPENRRSKVQLINGVHPIFTKKIKSLGKKQYEISDEGIALITSIYKAYKPSG